MTTGWALLLLSASCKDDPPVPSPVRFRIESIGHVEGPSAVVLSAKLSARNRTAEAQSAFVFMYAENDAPRPPTRGIWPTSATIEMNNGSHGLIVATPSHGHRVDLGPKAESTIDVEIVVPPGRSRFRYVDVQLFGSNGQRYIGFTKSVGD